MNLSSHLHSKWRHILGTPFVEFVNLHSHFLSTEMHDPEHNAKSHFVLKKREILFEVMLKQLNQAPDSISLKKEFSEFLKEFDNSFMEEITSQLSKLKSQYLTSQKLKIYADKASQF